MSQPDLDEQWLKEQWLKILRRNKKPTLWSCIFCEDRCNFTSVESLWLHASSIHHNRLPAAEDEEARESFRHNFEAGCAEKKPTRDARKPAPPPSGNSERHLSFATPRLSYTPVIGALNLGTPHWSDDVTMQDASPDLPLKRLAIGDGIAAGSASPEREQSPDQPPPRRSKGRPNSAPYEELRSNVGFESSKPNVGRKQLWTPDQGTSVARSQRLPPQDEAFDILRQSETRPISQEQLVTEVKGIYAGLVMVGARLIEVDGKHADENIKMPAKYSNGRRGVKGIVNGQEIWAFGDTGAGQNIISSRRVKEMGLKMKHQPALLRMGNSNQIASPGIVRIQWAFPDDPLKVINIVAHVLDDFKYGCLLGNPFLRFTNS